MTNSFCSATKRNKQLAVTLANCITRTPRTISFQVGDDSPV
jgi:hypothetical protein